MFYYLAIGTNISAEQNAVAIIRKLIESFGRLYVFPYIVTQPENMQTANYFLNSVVIISTTLDSNTIKSYLNDIEHALGRDRNDPDRSNKDRSADIDILDHGRDVVTQDAHPLAEERFIQDVLAYTGKMIDLSEYGLPFSERAATVDLDKATGNLVIIDNTIDSFVNGH